ncbi:hypothetical protein [Achromobacter sp.]|uniref:hypothetical protein n=1 Tax=Achromobacter sp. TaxID=134375 RepID=UPI002F9599FD
MRAVLAASAEFGMLMAQSTAYLVPAAGILALILCRWPQRFGKLGTRTFRRGIAVGMLAVWVFALVLLGMFYWLATNHDSGYEFPLLGLMPYMSPSLLTALIVLLVHRRISKRESGHE